MLKYFEIFKMYDILWWPGQHHCSIAESAPTSPGSRVDASRQISSDLNEHTSNRLTADYPILPVLSSSAPEREGIWHEVRRKSTERLKVTMPKDTTSKQSVEVCFESVFCRLISLA